MTILSCYLIYKRRFVLKIHAVFQLFDHYVFRICLKLLVCIFPQVDGIRANFSGDMVSLVDICMKPLGQDCATQSVLQVYL